jgi:hypothetical protein
MLSAKSQTVRLGAHAQRGSSTRIVPVNRLKEVETKTFTLATETQVGYGSKRVPVPVEIKHAEVSTVAATTGPVFLLQTRRSIKLED